MKIERISENSIRCTLTGFDLSVRNLNIRELAYGSEKARKLFNEMMQKTRNEVGFEAENTPIMIEAIPLNGDSIQLVITKVEDPEELDTRFSKFSPMPKGSAEDWVKKLTSELLEGADGLLRQIQQLGASGNQGQAFQQPGTAPAQGQTAAGEEKASKEEISCRAFAFHSLDLAISAAKAAGGYQGCSILYKKPGSREYVLLVESRDASQEDFARVCNTAAEYGRKLEITPATLAYYEEHYDIIIGTDAIQKLSRI